VKGRPDWLKAGPPRDCSSWRWQVVRGVAGYEIEEPVSEYEVQVAMIRQTSGKWLNWLESQDLIDIGRSAFNHPYPHTPDYTGISSMTRK
jgi:hypothetical protein